jgi:methylenetetrahydrofolate dehydrogenase (NADP+)/methenyltetrahydrofolate cyclohydrolase
MILLDGKATAQKVKEAIRDEVTIRKEKGLKTPNLIAVLVGENPASMSYVKSKVKACDMVGFESSLIHLDINTSEQELLELIAKLNADTSVDGYIVQLPLPKDIDENKVLLAVAPEKDVDGFHPINIGRLTLSLDTIIPATPFGIITLIEEYGIETSGKNVVVVGRSNIVGRPMSILLSQNKSYGNATVTLTHSRTKNLAAITKEADIIVAAIGKPFFITADMVKEGVAIIDVGINRIEDASRKRGYRLVGDVDFDNVASKTAYITPVPGGVGPMTIAMLLKNTLLACN